MGGGGSLWSVFSPLGCSQERMAHSIPLGFVLLKIACILLPWVWFTKHGLVPPPSDMVEEGGPCPPPSG